MARSPIVVRIAWAIWVLFAVGITIAVVCSPTSRTVTPNYHQASHNWFDGLPLYEEGPHGFLYFPQAAILFAPFAYLCAPWGDVAWRVAGIGALAAATWRLSLLLRQRRRPVVFLLATLTTIPPALAAARNGQMNLLLTACTTFGFVELARRRQSAAAAWFCLGLALKPLMAFPIVLAGAANRRVIPALTVGVLAVVIAPFLLHEPNYVWQQYEACLSKLFRAGAPGTANPHADLFGMFAAAGWVPPLPTQTAIRLSLAAAALCLGRAARGRMAAPQAGLYWLTLAVGCLALINPRMENNGYVLLAPALGGLAAVAWTRRRRKILSGLLVAMATVGIAGSYELTRGPNFWLCPLFTSLVLIDVIAGFRPTSHRSRRLLAARPEIRSVRKMEPRQAPGWCDHDLTVVVPAFNEESRLPSTLTALKSWMEASGLDYRVLVVDDGSSDSTAFVSDRLGQRFRTLRLPARRGKGAAVRAGMRAATGRVVAFTDADLPYELDALGTGYEWINSGRCEIVFGSRDIEGAATHVSRRLTRALASLVFRCLTKRLISRDITDTQCGLKMFDAHAGRAVFARAVIDGFAFDAEIVWLCHDLGLAWRRVPVTLVNEYGSTLSISRHAWRMLWDLPRLRIVHGSRTRGARRWSKARAAVGPRLRTGARL